MNNQRDRMLFELEQRLARVGGKLSAQDASLLIADDFVEFGASGKVWTKNEIVTAICQWEPSERVIENFTVRELGADVCLVTYKIVGPDKEPFPFRSEVRSGATTAKLGK